MAEHLTEQEQIEALKNWWTTYWKSIVLPILIVALGYSGWTFWQKHSAANAALGSSQYLELTKVMETAPGAPLTEQQRTQAKVLADALVDDFGGSLYADHANLILARLAVEEKALPAAEAYLQRVIDKGANAAIRELAKARLARVHIAQDKTDAALALVAVAGDSSYKALYAEIRGDALAQQGKAEQAKTAFQEAIDALPPSDFNRRSLIQLKVDGIDILAGKVAASTREDSPSDSVSEDTSSVEPASTEAAQASTENP